jgi:hypothetical protein
MVAFCLIVIGFFCVQVTELLVKHGATVNVSDLWKFTPLHEAAAKAGGRTSPSIYSVLRIRDVYPGYRIRFFPIPDPHFNPKKWFLSSRKYDPGCSFRIRIQFFFYLSRIKGQKGTGSRFLDPDPQH